MILRVRRGRLKSKPFQTGAYHFHSSSMSKNKPLTCLWLYSLDLSYGWTSHLLNKSAPQYYAQLQLVKHLRHCHTKKNMQSFIHSVSQLIDCSIQQFQSTNQSVVHAINQSNWSVNLSTNQSNQSSNQSVMGIVYDIDVPK